MFNLLSTKFRCRILIVIQDKFDHEGELSTGHQILKSILFGSKETRSENNSQVIRGHLVYLLVLNYSFPQKGDGIEKNYFVDFPHFGDTRSQKLNVVFLVPIAPVRDYLVVYLERKQRSVQIVEYFFEAS